MSIEINSSIHRNAVLDKSDTKFEGAPAKRDSMTDRVRVCAKNARPLRWTVCGYVPQRAPGFL